jgi:hypothetical protein
MNPYLRKLHALKLEKGHPHELTKLTESIRTQPQGGFVSSVSCSGCQNLEIQAASEADGYAENASQGWKNAYSTNRQNRQNLTAGEALAALEACCPRCVDPARWQVAVEDGRRFIGRWADQAAALGWTARDLFGLIDVPDAPHPCFDRLSRYDAMGLCWLLQGSVVTALSGSIAVIRSPSGAMLKYSRMQNA